MLKLFRKIRYKLIDEGSLKQYLIYAIGEILLVMIGILLALQVSTWNQDRIYHKKELKALTALSKEFKLNKERIIAKQNLRRTVVPRLESYINVISAGEAKYNSFKDFHSDEFMFGMTNSSNGVIDALISSGEIELISNDSLKYLLADWKNQVENLYENEQILWGAGLEFIGSYSSVIPHPGSEWKDWNNERLEMAFKDLISIVPYRNNLIGFSGVYVIVIEECDAILEVLDNTLILLDDEISKQE